MFAFDAKLFYQGLLDSSVGPSVSLSHSRYFAVWLPMYKERTV
jgi:hypothetical protein